MKKIIVHQKKEKLFEVQQKYKGIKKLLQHNISGNDDTKSEKSFIPFPIIGLNAASWKVVGI